MCKDNIVSLNQIDHPGEMTFFSFLLFLIKGGGKKKLEHKLNLKEEKGREGIKKGASLQCFFMQKGE